MKQIILFLLFLLPTFVMAQINPSDFSKRQVDSLNFVAKQTNNDTLKMEIFRNLSLYFMEKSRDSSIYYAEQTLAIAKKLKQPIWQGNALTDISYGWMHLGNYSQSFQAANEALNLAEDNASENHYYVPKSIFFSPDPHKNRSALLSQAYQKLAFLYNNTGNGDKAIVYLTQAARIAESIDHEFFLSLYYMNLGEEYYRQDKLDSALVYGQKAVANFNKSNLKNYLGFIYETIGQIYLKQNKNDSALYYFQQSLKVNKEQNLLAGVGISYHSLSQFFITIHQPDSTFVYGQQALEIYQQLNNKRGIANVYSLMSAAYKIKKNTDSAFVYLELSKHITDSLTRVDKAQTNKYQNLNFEDQLRLRKLEEEKATYQNKIRTNTLMGGLFTLLVIAFFLYRNNKQKQKANALLKEQKEEIQSTLEKLESTQSQLIQSEKMASLGELTAGIAHEIQNPLNFVNNFSEVSQELVEELKAERSKEKGERDEGLEEEILNDINQNLSKIHHHGQRASGIVKGMLEHSRTSDGKKEPTDLNALADEYLRLAYHGLRAKDNAFNADFKTEFDPLLPKVNVIPQDIGRVLLNLINNAFYAVDKKAARHAEPRGSLPAGRQESKDYKPLVIVSTKKLDNKIEISVKDNGDGIPSEIKDKIFQPFFTTKPTGSGTGLGLSLSYDIIKAHCGELKVETIDGQGSTFHISIPIKL